MRRATASAAKYSRTCGEGQGTNGTMSRIGKQPIALPGGVEVAVGGDNVVTVKGPRGSLTQTMHANMRIVVGVGYRAALKGKDLEVQVGYSHPVLVEQPDGIEFEVPTPTQIVVRGNDKAQVGEMAANIRKIRKPEPYKGKGIRYENEYVR